MYIQIENIRKIKKTVPIDEVFTEFICMLLKCVKNKSILIVTISEWLKVNERGLY